jgi:tetratricopeptide (TPR) repeat protein
MRCSLVCAALALGGLSFDAAYSHTGSSAVADTGRPTADVSEAKRSLASVDTCRLQALPELVQFIRKYEGRRDPELKSLAAEARYEGGWTLRFRGQDEQAVEWFKSVVRLYGRYGSLPFRRIVARANLMLGTTGHDSAHQEEYLRRVLSTYRTTDDLELLRTYADSLLALSDIRRASGQKAEADLLYKQADDLYHVRIIPRLPAPDPNTPICV